METQSLEEDWQHKFYIGQHESKRALPVTEYILSLARDCDASSPPTWI